MSRVDDDRDAERVAQRLLQQKLVEEAKKKDRAAQDSQFARLVGAQKEQAQRTEKDMSARSAIAHLLESSEADEKSEAGLADKRHQSSEAEGRAFRSRMGARSMGERAQANTRADGQRSAEAKLQSDQGRADSAAGRSNDAGASAKGAAGRAADAKAGRDVQAERVHATDEADTARNEQSSTGEGGDLKTDADKGGGGKQGGNSGGGDKKGDVPQGFRFNPALMAPVPVAQKNLSAGNDRLRRIASEIAQKIVEKVRVGTNAMGNAEFQIDLRSNVLSGLSVKVSAKNGRISAVFSGNDRDVLKMLEEQEEALKGALATRGLILERYKVEAKA